LLPKKGIRMKKIILYLSISFMAGVLFVNVYNSIVDAVSWGSNIPSSIEVMRHYYFSTNPGRFFRYFSPVNQLLALLTLIFFWKSSKQIRVYLAIAFLLSILTDVFTIAYFYPRNDLLVTLPLTDVSRLAEIVNQWQVMNWVRSIVIAVELTFAFLGLNLFFKLQADNR
jgi:hypothetical protein